MKMLPIFFIILFYSTLTIAQNNELKPRVSPKASVKQVVGITEIEITYGRPAVRGRVIWGELVPYGQIWRAGANEATTFSFSRDINLNDNLIKAGRYSFFLIPTENEWTVIFNNVADQWGAFKYDEKEDYIRFKVSPQKGFFTERLTYSFENFDDKTADIVLSWESIRLVFSVREAD